jgi:hypothetical protein
MKITDKRHVLKRMRAVREIVMAEIKGNAASGGLHARGFSAEGFAGGYLQALDDIDEALTHGYPSDHRGYWRAAKHRALSAAQGTKP